MSRIIDPEPRNIPDGISSWIPDTSGKELDRFKESLKHKGFRDDVIEKITRDCARILGYCIRKSSSPKDSRAGLVVGNIQSGKTSSFTGVTALAADNGFDLIIILCGNKRNLSEQNQKRIAKDLQLTQWRSSFQHLRDAEKYSAKQIQTESDKGGTTLLTLFKGSKAVQKLTAQIEKLSTDFEGDVLIIDDEADAITPNTKARTGDESATYGDIKALRVAVGLHTYVGYTATPQAQLVINTMDTIAPEFSVVLEPGDGYIGYKELFIDKGKPNRFTRFIALDQECLDRSDPRKWDRGKPLEPPKSLKQAQMRFYLTVAMGIRDSDPPSPSHRSMMIHPHGEKMSHNKFSTWVESSHKTIIDCLEGNPQSVKRQLDEFKNEWQELQKHSKGRGVEIGEFSTVENLILESVKMTKICIVNSDSKNEIWDDQHEWSPKNYSHILIGGQNLDRGFTVEGLTITYMPRSTGGNQVDTIAQRARFCGYSKKYVNLISIYMSETANKIYKEIVPHEASMKAVLKEHENCLKSAKAKVLQLGEDLRLTRPSIVTSSINTVNWKHSWKWHLDSNHPVCPMLNPSNARAVKAFREKYKSDIVAVDRMGQKIGNDECDWLLSSSPTDGTIHDLSVGLTLETLYNELIKNLSVNSEIWDDAIKILGQLQTTSAKDQPATVAFMSPKRTSRRTITQLGKIDAVNSRGDPKKYEGDQSVRPESARVVLRIHTLDLEDASKNTVHKDYIAPVLGAKCKELCDTVFTSIKN